MSLVKREDSVESENTINSTETENSTYKAPEKSLFEKLKTLIISLVVIAAIWIWGYMFYKNWNSILVDNPTDKEISVKLNSDWVEKKISPNTGLEMKIKSGDNEVFLNWKSVWKFQKGYMDFNAFLNPTKSIYISEYWLYSDRDWYESKLPINKIEAYWNKTEGPFKKYEWLFIKWTWDYYLNQEFPETISLWKRKHYKIKEKLFRYSDFVKMYNKEYANKK